MLTRRIAYGVLFTIAAASSAGISASQYAGQESREIKALSASEVTGLLAGNGMGFAKAAELNGYPGPAHVLELTQELKLTEDQVARTQALHAQMETEAKAAGRSLVDAERELDALFGDRRVTPELLTSALGRIATFQAQAREAHLKAHLAQTELLSAEQIAQYIRLRGYAPGVEHPHHGDHHH